MRKPGLFIVSLFISVTAHAVQLTTFAENATVPATIAAHDITRIVVKADRIQSVRGVKGAYVRENDEAQGEIYVQPTLAYQRRAFTVLITTEAGRHVTLLLNPLAVPAETLLLIPQGVGPKKALAFEQAAPYALTLVHLIRALVNDTPPDGYARLTPVMKKSTALGHQVILTPLMRYEGVRFRGELLAVTNTQSHTLLVEERDFWSPGVRAISLEAVRIAPQQNIRLYRVISHA